MFGRDRSGSDAYWPDGEEIGGDDASLSEDLADFGLDRRDWRRIGSLLREADTVERGAPADPAAITRAVEGLTGTLGGRDFVPAAAVTNGLLDLWAAVAPGGRQAARPVEKLLTALLHRHLVSAGEITSLCEEVGSTVGVGV